MTDYGEALIHALASTREYNRSQRPFYAAAYTPQEVRCLKPGDRVLVNWGYQDSRLLTVKQVTDAATPRVAFENTDRIFESVSVYHTGSIWGIKYYSD